MRVAPDCRQPLTAWHVSQTFTSTSHPPQQQDSDCHAVHRELCPGTGKGASTGVGRGQCCCSTTHGLLRATSGPAPAVVRPAVAAPHDTSPSNNNRTEERKISCHQQPAPPPCDAAKMSPHISICPEPVLATHAQSPTAAGSGCKSPLGNRNFFLSCPATGRPRGTPP